MWHLRLVFRLILLIVVILGFSCSPERSMARKYALKVKETNVLVLLPDEVWLVNQKSDYPKSSFRYEDAVRDERLLENTLILSKLNKKEVLRLFGANFISELTNYGLKVYTENQADAFLQVDSSAYILNLAQLELQEYYHLVEDEVIANETLYTYDFTINGFNLGLWLELNRVNDNEQRKPRLLFATHDILDKYEGYFTMRFMTGKVDYKLKVDSLNPERVRNFVAYLGRLYAAYTFDYMMNDYVARKQAPGRTPKRYFRWDPYNKNLKATLNDRFIELED